ncbi:hypothetical protein [Bacillus cereus group sp. TH152-1LC]|uniref:hypothetical protein n=1 Tax=Bacillus cereus group sp. TH152-1LC TaxID=3018060 RepID=UPI0022E71F6E|nr:hypothetical protein [Bacillus cereus group sp. TH152-1LC]MDA1675132.1 hypothetical protein [Bacillus cereus group sp. TH152-1LC]
MTLIFKIKANSTPVKEILTVDMNEQDVKKSIEGFDMIFIVKNKENPQIGKLAAKVAKELGILSVGIASMSSLDCLGSEIINNPIPQFLKEERRKAYLGKNLI